jgi:protein-S-isoprenylcysteine O-methyltransferase Ste14
VNASPTSFVLVALQVAALAALVWPWNAASWHPAGFAAIVPALALKAWTIVHNRPGNFGVLPEPRSNARLVMTGPYAYVRHPLYSGLMLFGLGCAIGWATPWHWLALVGLLAVLSAKARREETLLAARFAEYAAYAQGTPRFVPRVTRASAG